MGAPEYPTNEQLDDLRQESKVLQEDFNDYKVNNGNSLLVNIEIPPYGIALLEFEMAEA